MIIATQKFLLQLLLVFTQQYANKDNVLTSNCVFLLCSYSGFPVLNIRLFELQDGPRVPTAPSVLRHISPISPAAIFRRSQQVSLSYNNPIKSHPTITLLKPPSYLSSSLRRRSNQPRRWLRPTPPSLRCGLSVFSGTATACGSSPCLHTSALATLKCGCCILPTMC